MVSKFFLVVLLTVVLFSLQASAVSLSSNGDVHTVSQGNLTFVTDPSGLVKVFKNGDYLASIGFTLKGTVNSQQKFLNSWSTDWTWQVLSNTDSNVTVLASNTWQGLDWKQRWFFSDTEQKFTNYLTNNTGFDSTNTSFYYVVRFDSVNVPCLDYTDNTGAKKNYCFEQDKTITQNLEQYLKRIRFVNTLFDFQDLIDSGFEFNYLFAGQLNNVNSSLFGNGFIVGVTKNGGLFPNGASVILDPTIKTGLVDTTNPDIFAASSPNVFRVNSTSLGFIANATDGAFFARYYQSVDNGLNWSEADFNFYAKAGDDSPGVVFNTSNNKVVLVNLLATALYAQEGDFDNNLLARTGWDNNVALGFTGSIDAGRRAIDINSGQGLHVCAGQNTTRDIECRYVDTDLNTADISNWSALESSFSLSGNLQAMDYYIDSSDNGIFLYQAADGNKFVSMKVRYDVNGSWSNDLNLTAGLADDQQWRITGNQIVETVDGNLVVLLTTFDATSETVLRFCDDGAEACVSNINNWDTYRTVYDENALYWANLATDTNNNVYVMGTDCSDQFCSTNQAAQGLTYRIFYDLNKTVSAKFDVNAFDSNAVIDSTRFTVTANSDLNGLIDLVYFIGDSDFGTAQLEYFEIFGDGNLSILNASFTTNPTSPIALDVEEGVTNVQVDFNSNSQFLPSGRIVDINYLWLVDGEEISTDENTVWDFNGADSDTNVTLIVSGNDEVDTLTSQDDQNILLRSAPQGIDFNFTNNAFANNVDVNFMVTATGTINFAVWGGTDFDTNLLGTNVNKTFNQNKISQVCVIVNGAGDVNKLLCKDYVVARWLVSPAIDEETNASLTDTITNYNRPNQTYTHSADINVFTFYGEEVNYDTNAAFLIDFNTSYFTRNYFFDLDENQTFFLLQPRLPLVANSIQSTIFTIDNFTRDTVPEIVIQAIRTIAGEEVIVESTISDSTGTATMSFVANLDYTLRFLDSDGTILSEGPLGPKSTVLYAFIGTAEINFVLTPVGELVIQWIPNASSIDANTNFAVRFNQIINQVDLNITTITVRISQGDTNFFIQDFNFTGADTNIFQDVNVLDANQFNFMIVTITAQTPDGNFTKSFSYILVFTAGGSLVKNIQDIRIGLGPTVVLIIAVIITLFVIAGFAKVVTNDFNWLGLVGLLVLGIFTYLLWIPLTVFLVSIIIASGTLVYRWMR